MGEVTTAAKVAAALVLTLMFVVPAVSCAAVILYDKLLGWKDNEFQ